LRDLIRVDVEDGEYFMEANDELLKELEGKGVDNFFQKDKQEFGVNDGEAGLYVTLLNRIDDVVLLEYYDSFMSMYNLARWGDVKDMKIIECNEDGSCGVITPSKDQFDIVSD